MEVTDPDVLAVVEGILGDSEAYYLNIHSAEFPAGVLREQLVTKEIDHHHILQEITLFHQFTSFSHDETSGAAHATVTDKLDLIGDRGVGKFQYRVLF